MINEEYKKHLFSLSIEDYNKEVNKLSKEDRKSLLRIITIMKSRRPNGIRISY